ncbi:hypothetical protein R3P38DRAFT_3595996 [Favolaschia claudopus]|uniref:Uncharacterized protein n=1 Tax=Favolaschia claudopus TaxID=2862362 RepID=A0AAW0DKF9_9AGAR
MLETQATLVFPQLEVRWPAIDPQPTFNSVDNILAPLNLRLAAHILRSSSHTTVFLPVCESTPKLESETARRLLATEPTASDHKDLGGNVSQTQFIIGESPRFWIPQIARLYPVYQAAESWTSRTSDAFGLCTRPFGAPSPSVPPASNPRAHLKRKSARRGARYIHRIRFFGNVLASDTYFSNASSGRVSPGSTSLPPSLHADLALTSLLRVNCSTSFIWRIALSITINPFTSRLRALTSLPSTCASASLLLLQWTSSAPDALRARISYSSPHASRSGSATLRDLCPQIPRSSPVPLRTQLQGFTCSPRLELFTPQRMADTSHIRRKRALSVPASSAPSLAPRVDMRRRSEMKFSYNVALRLAVLTLSRLVRWQNEIVHGLPAPRSIVLLGLVPRSFRRCSPPRPGGGDCDTFLVHARLHPPFLIPQPTASMAPFSSYTTASFVSFSIGEQIRIQMIGVWRRFACARKHRLCAGGPMACLPTKTVSPRSCLLFSVRAWMDAVAR